MNLFEKYQEEGRKRSRIRELGISIGEYPTGPLNSITDVKGVKVGHSTLIEGSGRRKPGNGPVRTGVTVIQPNEDPYNQKVVAGGFVLNGAGEVSGMTQVMEWGLIETPIALTNTLSVGRVSDCIVKWMAEKHPAIQNNVEVIIPVVGECDDSFLNDAVGLHIKPNHVFSALDTVSDQLPLEGAVGAGTGMICCDFKAGIGTSSRIVPVGDKKYTIGVLVLSNFGVMEHLRIDGYPVGRVLAKEQGGYSRRVNNYGSIITVIATDMPLVASQINRLCKRAALGIGRVGSYGAHSSGEIIIGFSTTNSVPRNSQQPLVQMTMILDTFLDGAYKAVIEATEESILNSLTAAVEMEGVNGNRIPALGLVPLKDLLQSYSNVKVQNRSL
ncbi:MAG: S58 family peptidase [Proteobacteria bacterium]|nr:S58 family peptidase [Pseudomonadota bacterium]NDC25065.1 S58 family peptidase [Pseudomonadota bacterium]NDD04788.1 S58 family peptidase [Pseudomonadota bacterium]